MNYRLKFIQYNQWQRILLVAICISMASQISFPIYTKGFIITLSGLLLPIFLYFNGDLNPLKLTFAIAIASPLFRGLQLLICNEGSYQQVFQFVITDMAFYLCYGFLYYFPYWRKGERDDRSFFLTIVICDYLSNLLEVSLLINFQNYSYNLFQLLCVVSLVRGILSCFVALGYHYFTLLLQKGSHEQRYYHFIWIASSIKSEVYFMHKNISEIENVMKNSYVLNERLKNKPITQEDSGLALKIAHDVHEIKKDYINVTSALGDYYDTGSPMMLSDILKVVTSYAQEVIREKQLSIVIEVKNQLDLVVPNHYYIVSILSNLIFNGIEALDHKKNGLVQLTIQDLNKEILITVHDNGCGMNQTTKKLIFQPGFTTKFNKKTGNVYRGIGLSHLKTIVQEKFGGYIEVTSKEKTGTTFKVFLKKAYILKGDPS
ncbi:MAG: HAMP domain-containing sensor histidine kinase [Liquorilactobacillus nagelii]|uniref:histidine kinase n=2 Tax=Liquorilactobacillus nagelii TaxID=82688 RepID=A0A3S6QXF0_9LACO|nr:HAMP domain-containing sensor histidine kinase [Liquorilactobacillus nagelii]AUJ32886.1 ATP-binding protein [Liquorilactobacillus nagelii]MCC7616367.1 ATP-binding protein [Liquorilactobacillus nagelii]MCI1699826.1 HAMP domain-containing histidine kinase [Liquorilactobacillus nagelii]MCP9315126.1 HAMP domain-containing histidine kinase [Liquorilactobacillus nagelii]